MSPTLGGSHARRARSATTLTLRGTTPIQKTFNPQRTPSLSSWLFIALCWAGHLVAADWPQWRGPDRAAVWTGSGIVETLPKTGLKIRWRVPTAPGISHPGVVAGQRFVRR